MLRFLTSGESHGPGLVTIIEGLPKGLQFVSDDLSHELARRRLGHGRGGRMKIEQDELEVLGGIRHGRTLGSPVAVLIRNTEAKNWERPMSVTPIDEPVGTVSRPRPGHADLAGMMKYDTHDARDILERASARETAARTVAGYVARVLLHTIGIEVRSHVVSIGDVSSKAEPGSLQDMADVDADPVRCLDPDASREMIRLIDQAVEEKNTLGGVVEVIGFGVPVGLGSHVHYDRKIDGLLAQAMMSIPAIKAVEIGDGFEVAHLPGTEAHDEMVPGPKRLTNRAGGVEGGMTNGEPVRVRAAMKPISTLMRPLRTVDVDSGEPASAVRERSDVCAVPAAGVVAEQMLCWVLASEAARTYGGDTVGDFTASVDRVRQRVSERFEK